MNKTYEAFIDSVDCVHDGDTIMDVHIRLPGVHADVSARGEIFPEIYGDCSMVFMRINVRLAGIDCPEMEPRHRTPDGKLRPELEREHEKKLAVQAQRVVADALLASDRHFQIRNPQEGKYATRVVAEVWVKGENLSQKLLDMKLAYEYDGGTKRRWGLPHADGSPRLID